MGINTLFAIMALNDWQDMVKIFCAALALDHSDNPEDAVQKYDNTNYVIVQMFFITFMIATYYVILNILVAFIIDAYSQL